MKRVYASLFANLGNSTTFSSRLPKAVQPRFYASSSVNPRAMAQVQAMPQIDHFLPFDLTNNKPRTMSKPAYSLISSVAGMAKRPNVKTSTETDVGQGFGEDSYFQRHDAIGVADGVGGWSLNNGNSAFYSRQLMHYALLELNKYDDIDNEEFVGYDSADPKNVLAKCYDRANFDAYMKQIKGSTTALLALLRGDELRVANLGDCGVCVIRNGEFLFRSEEQQHAFNYPYQLGIVGGDNPLSGQRYNLKVKKGDIVIIGSDGLFDNLYDEDILETVQSSLRLQEVGMTATRVEIQPALIAERLMLNAREVAENSRNVTSPFSERAAAEGLYHQGGKLDDITVVVGVVWDNEDSPDRR
ncbi:hypothetical protein DSO57_1034752 [Entomophthora muscae]|uniref:Uncharacterized protein n=1 Tax=Entomophthora muscae TaxID=34485 RepID=A0ACC2REK1_9FUNG|nr:hypothetical protein DSO57_1034752 [Entomophthora muscae]